MQELRHLLLALVAADRPMTVRQVFYQAVSAGIIEKREAEYRSVCLLLKEMRRDGTVPWGWITDITRFSRKPRTFSSVNQAVLDLARSYRRAIWDSQEEYVQVWCEKDALAGVLYEVTQEWDVPLMVTRGYPSLTYLREAAQVIRDRDQPTHLFYLGDHDPSGLDIERVVDKGLHEFSPHTQIHLVRVAVTPSQIAQWGLPTRPTKKTDSRAGGFERESVEVDAIPPRQLRQLVRECIERHVDIDGFARIRSVEASERSFLESIVRQYFP